MALVRFISKPPGIMLALQQWPPGKVDEFSGKGFVVMSESFALTFFSQICTNIFLKICALLFATAAALVCSYPRAF